MEVGDARSVLEWAVRRALGGGPARTGGHPAGPDSRGCASAAMPGGRAGITGTPSFTSAGTCTKSWKATGFAMRGRRGLPRRSSAGVSLLPPPGGPARRTGPPGPGAPARDAARGRRLPPVTADEPPYRQLIEGYCRFLRQDRGLAETTVASCRRYLRDFLVSRGAGVSPAELAALGADDLLAFSRPRGAGLGRTAWNHLATALSGFYQRRPVLGGLVNEYERAA